MSQKQKKAQKFKYVRLVTIETDQKLSAKELRETIIRSVEWAVADLTLDVDAKVSVRNVDTDK